MTHAPVCNEALAKAGINENLVRLSVGLESPEDLVADVIEALETARKADVQQPVVVAAAR